jgi:hypothetical protein
VRKGGDKFGGIVGIHTRHGIAGEGGKGLRQRMRPGEFEAGRPAIMGISASSNEGGTRPRTLLTAPMKRAGAPMTAASPNGCRRISARI